MGGLTETPAVNVELDGYENSQFGDATAKLLEFDENSGMLNFSFPLKSVNLTTMRRSLNRPSHVNKINVPPLIPPDVGCRFWILAKN
jgi:hypothetical protein